MCMCWRVKERLLLTGQRVVGPGGDVWVPLSHPLRQPLQLLCLGPATERRSPHLGLVGSGPGARHDDPSTMASVRRPCSNHSLSTGGWRGSWGLEEGFPLHPASPNLSHSETSLLGPPEPGTLPSCQPYLQLLL